MNRNDFEKLKKLKFGRIPLPKLASWAIWDKKIKGKNQDIPQVVEENVAKLKSNIVFVALNFGNEKEEWKNSKDWQNFHSVKSLIKLLSGTRFEGAYMTDIIKNYHNSKSSEVMEVFNNCEKMRKENIDFFFDEIALLKSKNIEMYLFGRNVETIFRDYVMHHKNFSPFKKKVKKCQPINHYMDYYHHFKDRAPVQLGIRPPKNATERNYKYDPLW